MQLLEKLMFLLPSTCVLCGSLSRQLLCAPCQHVLPILSHHCLQCAQIQSTDKQCGACLRKPPPYDRTFALFPYQAPIVRLITDLKFQGHLAHAKLLGELLAEKIKNEWYRQQPLPDLIIPIPLHPLRLKERGFNQALEIARPIGKIVNIPIDPDGARRIKNTVTQTTLSAKYRQKNMSQAFEIERDYRGLHIAVLDDVMTTQHTMRSFAGTLKQAGVSKIDAWCCARALFDIAQRPKTR